MFKKIYYKFIIKPYQRICTVFEYAKQGFFTYEWDYEYLLSDIEFKIKRMRKYLDKEGIIDKVTLKSMEDTLGALKKWEDEEHYEIYEKELTQKYGKLIQVKQEADERGFIPFVMKREKETEENKKQIDEDAKRAYMKSYVDEVNDKNIFFKLLKNNIEKWWS